MKTKSLKSNEISKDWYIANAEGKTLGRFASEVAKVLRGKHKPTFTPHMDMGDNVIVVNAEKVQFTGNKLKGKNYYWHTGYPGGIKSRSAEEILESNFPERVLVKAVKRMLPGGVLSRKQMTNLKVYSGSEHPHEAQKPEIVDVRSMNKKNSRE